MSIIKKESSCYHSPLLHQDASFVPRFNLKRYRGDWAPVACDLILNPYIHSNNHPPHWGEAPPEAGDKCKVLVDIP